MNNMYKIKFSKLDKMKFVGHLDLLKLFQRAIRRANLPISYSQGFNPHQIVSFGLPLPVGMGSCGEYIDIQLDEDIEPLKVKESLNLVMPEGIEIIDVRKFYQSEKNSASSIEAGIYEIEFPKNIPNFKQTIQNILALSEISVEKSTKGGSKTVDIRNSIYSIDVNEEENIIIAMISSGSKLNLKPQLLVEFICSYIGKEFDEFEFKYKRIDLLKNQGDKFVSIFDTI